MLQLINKGLNIYNTINKIHKKKKEKHSTK